MITAAAIESRDTGGDRLEAYELPVGPDGPPELPWFRRDPRTVLVDEREITERDCKQRRVNGLCVVGTYGYSFSNCGQLCGMGLLSPYQLTGESENHGWERHIKNVFL